MKYDVRLRSGKQGWNEVDHCAKFLFDVSEWHTTRPAGLWFKKRVGVDVGIDEIYEKIWQMYLRENYLHERARKANFVRRFNGGGFHSNDCVEKGHKAEVGSTNSLGDEDANDISETKVGMCIRCDADGDASVLDNVTDMTYEQLRNTITTRLSLKRKKLSIRCLKRFPSYHKITDINFDEYKHDLSTHLDGPDFVSLETTTTCENHSAGDVAVDDATGLAGLAAALKLGNDEMELDVENMKRDEVGTVDEVQQWVRRHSGWGATVNEWRR